MKTRADIASTDLFHNGFNCAQSVIGVFCHDYDLDQEDAFRIACGLGGGCRCGDLCGAVSGGVLVVGLRYGNTSAEDTAAKATCDLRTAEFTGKFMERHGSVTCRELLGIDLSLPENREKANAQNLFDLKCRGFVRDAVQLLEELGY